MATLLLSAAGSALGGSLGGSFLGVGVAAVGKAVGAAVGSMVDQRLLGAGAEPVETGRVERFRVMGSSEGAPLPRVWGRTRVAGQVIWSSRFLEHSSTSSAGGKGGGGTTVREFSYTVSFAVALCEGPILRVGRIWADGQVLEQKGLNWRLHPGDEEQIPDPLIAAIEGAEATPAYRGTAYVVFEDLDLTPFGNRIPQFNFEVFRRAQVTRVPCPEHPANQIRAVALVPGTGEYALATEPVSFLRGKGENTVVNVHNDEMEPDIVVSLEQMKAELPKARAASLVVTWFGNDMRAGRCRLAPKVEQQLEDGDTMAWQVAGLDRRSAERVSLVDGRPLFGGTPSDQSVIQAIRHMRDIGVDVMFYPFILMDILAGNGLTDPWTGAQDQPPVPWRGRITLDVAPGVQGSSDQTAEAGSEVDRFLGTAAPADFSIEGDGVRYSGPEEWTYRRFILHYAHLCAAAGGVEAFCVGSELRGLSQIRDARTSYPFVRALVGLVEDVRGILGDDCKIGYAADWSEYFGHHPDDGLGDLIYHLDPLWSNPEVDFVGIDNYMPLSDWRDSEGHADASHGSIYDLDYLKGNVRAGEGYDWYYADPAARDAQVRTPITDGAYGEPWVFRYKDIQNWWSRPHVNRIGGAKTVATGWVPSSKPIWFTELGCPAVDKGTNQPNVFYDPKSSESFLPYYSRGNQDTFIQERYLQASYGYWSDAANNPLSAVYGGAMVDLENAYVWAWDTRPWPDFPARAETWLDGSNYALGHWLNGRTALAPLEGIVAEVAETAGLDDVDVSGLFGVATGYSIDGRGSGRQGLQPLMLAFGFDGVAVAGKIAFRTRGAGATATVDSGECVRDGEKPSVSYTRSPLSEVPSLVTLGYVDGERDYIAGAVSARQHSSFGVNASESSLPIVLDTSVAQTVADRWLSESLVARDAIELVLPPSRLELTPGDVVSLLSPAGLTNVRIDRIEELGARRASGVRVDAAVYEVRPETRRIEGGKRLEAPASAYGVFLDLPLLTGDEAPHAPHFAVAQKPWSGSVSLFSSADDYGYQPNLEIRQCAVLGEFLNELPPGIPGLFMGAVARVRVTSGSLQTRSETEVLNGANVAAVRSLGSEEWEVVQFRQAKLVAAGVYDLSGILRGQAGTDSAAPGAIPIGSEFVLLNSAVKQSELNSAARGLERHYRFGPSKLAYDSPRYQHVVRSFPGVGLRPYSPVHLAATRLAGGDVRLEWTRRSRIDGDSWEGVDVPLGEQRELYHVRLFDGETRLREVTVSDPWFLYTAALQATDGAAAELAFEVAQVSERFGPGPYRRKSL